MRTRKILREAVASVLAWGDDPPSSARDVVAVDVSVRESHPPTMASSPTTLRKIDCIMVKVDDVEKAREFYVRTFGMIPVWKDIYTPGAAGLRFPESDTEIVLHNIADIPVRVDVTYLVEDVAAALAALKSEGCAIVEGPFDVTIGKCAIITDPFGTPMTIIDMTKGPRT